VSGKGAPVLSVTRPRTVAAVEGRAQHSWAIHPHRINRVRISSLRYRPTELGRLAALRAASADLKVCPTLNDDVGQLFRAASGKRKG
jgi:hypothetical protein